MPWFMAPPQRDGGASAVAQEELSMRKVIECRSVVPGCNFVAHGPTDEDVMMEAAEHVHTTHGVEHLSEQLRAKLRAAIREIEQTK